MSQPSENVNLLHWNYFLALEADLANVSRFIEFSPANLKTYSIELSHLLLATASEVDVVAKQLCNVVAPSRQAENIQQYREILTAMFPDIANVTVVLPRYGLQSTPWQKWENEDTPQWWSDHNKVKHDRTENFDKANLENVLHALAGLFTLLLYFYRQQSNNIRLEPVPNLFTAPRTLVKKDLFLGGYIALHFE